MSPALLLAALLAAPVAMPAPAAPRAVAPPSSEAARADRIEALLGSIDVAAAPEDWRALGPEAVPTLEKLAREPGEFPSRRARALQGLSFLGGAAAQRAVVELSRDEALAFSVRASALEGAGRLLAPAELARELQPALTASRHRSVRAVAAEVLAQRAPAQGCGPLRAQMAREPADARGAFQRATGMCGALGR
jgi:hypothetical protein